MGLDVHLELASEIRLEQLVVALTPESLIGKGNVPA